MAQLQQRLVEGVGVADASAVRAEAAAHGVAVALRAELAAAAAAAAATRAHDVAEQLEAATQAQRKVAEEMRWLDEEHMRCRAEDQAAHQHAVEALREELGEELRSGGAARGAG